MPDASPVEALAADLHSAAGATDQRRLLVLSGDRDAGVAAAFDAVSGASVDESAVTVVTTREGFRFERLAPSRADALLGTTREMVVCDAHEGFSPNLLGRLAGVVDGGGLFVLLTPPLDEWPRTTTDFDARLAVPPFPVEAVTGRFRGRLADVLRSHPGVAVVDVGTGGDGDGEGDAAGAGARVVRDGDTDDGPLTATGRGSSPFVPDDAAFPAAAYESCLTRDQSRAVAALERLRGGGAVVVEADRGRGKSSAAGLGAAALAAAGREVLVTAPRYRNAAAAFARAVELLDRLGRPARHDEAAHVVAVDGDGTGTDDRTGGSIRFRRPPEAARAVADGAADVVLVDEAAALPVRVLESFLDAGSVAFFTTVHGYEGAGRGFSVRFRDRLDASDHAVTDRSLEDPIRYARGDPVESLSFRALCLDARPPVSDLVTDATRETVDYGALSPDDLLADDHRLREAFGLLVDAHYRTEPDDLARLLDAPNLTLRALTHAGRVVSVALLAREGGLDADTRRAMYEGARVRGNMVPDVLTSQCRDEAAAVPVGYRVVRIATHHAVRSRGLGSRLLAEVRAELTRVDPLRDRLPPSARRAATGSEDGRAGAGRAAVDWLGVGYGATPALVDFWRENGFRTVYLSTTRNETSGEHSAVMLSPLSPRGERLLDRHTDWFLGRVGDALADPLREVDPDVVRAALRSVARTPGASLSDREWRHVVDAAVGPGLYSTHPGPFRRLALRALAGPGDSSGDGDGDGPLDPRQERLLVRKVLQAHPWDDVADELGFVSTSQCMTALGDAYRPLVDACGGEAAAAQRRRYE